MSRKSIRNQSDIIIGKGLFKDLSNEIRLPTSELVIKRLFCYRLENPNSDVTRRDICTQVFQELKTVWQKAFIPVKTDKKCIDQLEELYGKWTKLKKVPNAQRASANLRLHLFF